MASLRPLFPLRVPSIQLRGEGEGMDRNWNGQLYNRAHIVIICVLKLKFENSTVMPITVPPSHPVQC